jgi:hypothetical protein
MAKKSFCRDPKTKDKIVGRTKEIKKNEARQYFLEKKITLFLCPSGSSLLP